MPPNNALELEIRNLLLSKVSPHDIVERLMVRFYESQFSIEDRRLTMAFAWNSGYIQLALDYFPDFFNARQLIPWAWFAEIMAKAKTPMNSDWSEALVKGARRQEQMDDLTLSHSWDHQIPEIPQWRKDVERRRLEFLDRQRQKLFEKLAFFRNEQLAEEERRLLDLLKKMYPLDREIDRLEQEFEERWARHIITKHSGQQDHFSERTEMQWSAGVAQAVLPMCQEMERVVKIMPHLTYEFAVALVCMDLETQADALISQPMDEATDWLRAELLLRARRFVDGLDHLTGLELRYCNDPETAFAITYLRAQAFWGLGQSSRAIELVQTLVSVRPHYRSAASLLKQWTEGRGL